jgi:hypothetical protein
MLMNRLKISIDERYILRRGIPSVLTFNCQIKGYRNILLWFNLIDITDYAGRATGLSGRFRALDLKTYFLCHGK